MNGASFWALAAGTLALSAAFAQDPLRTLPKNYTLEFENEVVRVIRVHYGAGEKLPSHDHPKTPTVYVYLADAGPVWFRHTGSEPFELQRPAVKKGGFRLSQGVVETHAVENSGDAANEFLRVELKTRPLGLAGFRGRFPPPENPSANLAKPSSNLAKVEFEDAHLRIRRVVCVTDDKCEGLSVSGPVLEVAFAPAEAVSRVRWIAEGSAAESANGPIHVLRIEFKG